LGYRLGLRGRGHKKKRRSERVLPVVWVKGWGRGVDDTFPVERAVATVLKLEGDRQGKEKGPSIRQVGLRIEGKR